MKKHKKTNEDDIEFKIIILGDSCSVKIFISLLFNNKVISTLGFGNLSKEIILKDGTKIRLDFIYTLGQENYQALSITYIKNADCALFTFTLNNRENFNFVKARIKDFLDNNPNVDFNKVLPAYIMGSNNDSECEIKEDEIQEVIKENNLCGYYVISDKDKEYLNNILVEIGEMLIKIYGKDKRKRNVKLSKKTAKKSNHLCQPDV